MYGSKRNIQHDAYLIKLVGVLKSKRCKRLKQTTSRGDARQARFVPPNCYGNGTHATTWLPLPALATVLARIPTFAQLTTRFRLYIAIQIYFILFFYLGFVIYLVWILKYCVHKTKAALTKAGPFLFCSWRVHLYSCNLNQFIRFKKNKIQSL